MPVAPHPNCDNQKCFQTLSNVPWGMGQNCSWLRTTGLILFKQTNKQLDREKKFSEMWDFIQSGKDRTTKSSRKDPGSDTTKMLGHVVVGSHSCWNHNKLHKMIWDFTHDTGGNSSLTNSHEMVRQSQSSFISVVLDLSD